MSPATMSPATIASLLAAAIVAATPGVAAAAQPASTPAPAPAAEVGPTPAPTVAPAPPPVDPELAADRRRARGLVLAGGATMAVGGAALVLVAWPARALQRRSLERAEEVRWVTQQDEHVETALRHRAVMRTAAGIGLGLATVGAVLLTSGLVQRSRLRSPSAATFALAPSVGGGHFGVGASVRF